MRHPTIHWWRIFLGALYVLGLGAVALLALRGASFYAAPLGGRAHHPDYWILKAGGSLGHPLGIAGSAMMIVMLLYSARKRFGALRRLGPLGSWLDVHIFLGTVGPCLVILHSSLKVQGLVALSFWSMIVVAVSGFLGRYLYLQIPRSRAGQELSLAEVEALDRELTARLRQEFGLDPARLQRLDALAAPPPGSRSVWRTLLGMLADDLRVARGLQTFARESRSVPPSLVREFRRTARQKALLRRRVLLWNQLHELFHYWHVVHKPFAVVMYIFMAVHVGVALATGYGGMLFP